MDTTQTDYVIGQIKRIDAEMAELKSDREFLVGAILPGKHLGTEHTLTLYPRQRGVRFSSKKARHFLTEQQQKLCMEEVVVNARVIIRKSTNYKEGKK